MHLSIYMVSAWLAIPPIAIFALFLFVLFILCLYRRCFCSISDIPGPLLASFTRLWHVHRILTGHFNLQLVKLHEDLGHFVRIAPNEVSVSHPDAVKQVLNGPLSKGHWYRALALPDYRFQNQASALGPDIHKKFSKHLGKGYVAANLLQSEDRIDSFVSKLLRWLDVFSERQDPVHLDKLFRYTSYDIAGDMLFSKDFGFLEHGSDIGGSIANAESLNQYIAVSGYFYWIHTLLFGNPIVTSTGLLPMGHLYNTTLKALDDRGNDADAGRDIVSYWFKSQLKTRDIHANALFALGAGSDTVGSALQAIIYHMVKHPAIYRRARDEIKAAQKHGRCRTPIVSNNDALKLPYLQACIKESLRVFSPFAFSIPRVVPKNGLMVGDRLFKAGTILSVNPWAMHHSKVLWGSNVEDFRPERWLVDDNSIHNRNYIPFGSGYGSCPGQKLAKIELGKITATVVRDYNIRQIDIDAEWQWKAMVTIVPHHWPVYINKICDSEVLYITNS